LALSHVVVDERRGGLLFKIFTDHATPNQHPLSLPLPPSPTAAAQDYGAILAAAEAEADIVLWDGGNNDLPFYKPGRTAV
jgi:predicted GTPase